MSKYCANREFKNHLTNKEHKVHDRFPIRLQGELRLNFESRIEV